MHVNDWMYCILPIEKRSPGDILSYVVMGSTLDLFSIDLDRGVNSRVHRIWAEDRGTVARGHNRALIAHLERMHKTNSFLISGSCFDGTVRLFNLNIRPYAALRQLHGHMPASSMMHHSSLLVQMTDGSGYVACARQIDPLPPPNIEVGCRVYYMTRDLT